MAASPSGDGDTISQYFTKGANVEISSNEDGLRCSWYAGTVIRPPKDVNKRTAKVLVEFETLMEEDDETQRLREEVDLSHLRPPPLPGGRRSFNFGEEVDAYYNEGWWEGIISEILSNKGNNHKYLVLFRGTREEIAFKASDLRLHHEWVRGKWVPPLEQGHNSYGNEEVSLSAEMTPKKQKTEHSFSPGMNPKKQKIEHILSPGTSAKKQKIGHNFSPGAAVEVSSDEDGLEGAWFSATIVKKIKANKYLIEYQNLKNDDDDTKLLKEEVDGLHLRPSPPDVELVDRFEALEQVEALYNDGWWVGVVAKVLKDDKYYVYFENSDEKLMFRHSDLRVHQKWINGKWVIPSKVQPLFSCYLSLWLGSCSEARLWPYAFDERTGILFAGNCLL
ncbi:hypothetical protein RD792_015900, partial [Penstemon davidsonii]